MKVKVTVCTEIEKGKLSTFVSVKQISMKTRFIENLMIMTIIAVISICVILFS
jgi:hypothetical protein